MVRGTTELEIVRVEMRAVIDCVWFLGSLPIMLIITITSSSARILAMLALTEDPVGTNDLFLDQEIDSSDMNGRSLTCQAVLGSSVSKEE